MSDERQFTLIRAGKALDEMYRFVGSCRKEEAHVACLSSDLDEGKEIITVMIGKGTYRVNVECNSVPAIIKEVVDATVMKI